LVLIQNIHGHSYLTTPITRSNQRQTQSGCRDTCGPCDPGTPTANPTVIARGQTIPITWPRNNHAGGFTRFAWTPTANSGTYAAFDAGVDSFFCWEIPASTCHSLTTDPLGGDDGNQYNCGNTITVPAWLNDGTWTMQWIWFGGIYFLGEYRSCVDFQVTGGVTYNPTIPEPTFYGGDVGYPGESACKFANTNTPHTCSEPCSGPFPSGQPERGTPNSTFIVGASTLSSASATSASAGATSASATSASATSASATSASATSASATSASATSASATSASATSASATSTGLNYPSSASATSASATSTGVYYPPMITTSPNDFAFIQGPQKGMCPNPDAPNLNGDILNPPHCGQSYPNSRCPDGQCCDQFGNCGPFPDPDGEYRGVINGVTQVITYEEALQIYCTNNQGNWAYIACTSNANIKAVSILVLAVAALLL